MKENEPAIVHLYKDGRFERSRFSCISNYLPLIFEQEKFAILHRSRYLKDNEIEQLLPVLLIYAL